MIRLWLGLSLLAFSGALLAGCELNSTQRSVDYLPVRPAERQQAGDKPVVLPEKQFVLHIVISHNVFGFSSVAPMRKTAGSHLAIVGK